MRHRFHSLCPYFAMFPEEFSRKWIEHYTDEGDLVLDPFCGRGTTPFQALLSRRSAIACDINPVAFCITRAKTNAPSPSSLRSRLTKLEKAFARNGPEGEAGELPEFFHRAFAPRTLKQIVFLRSKLRWRESRTDCMLTAIVLGILHGESTRSPRYLSNQMPRTISTKPRYSIDYWLKRGLVAPDRDSFSLLRQQIAFRYETPPPEGVAVVYNSDFRDLAALAKEDRLKPVDLVVTSPPYLDVTNFEEDQWLRGWFVGGSPMPRRTRRSRDDRYRNDGSYWRLIADFWRVVGLTVRPQGHVVVRIGGKRLEPERIVRQLTEASSFSRRRVRLVTWEVSKLRRKQTNAFRPGAQGCAEELDACFNLG